MEITKKVVGLILVIGFSVIPSVTYAQPHNHATSNAISDPIQVYKEAGASAEQETKIRQLARDFEVQAKVRFERLKNLLRQMQECAYEASPDEKKVLSLQDTINQLQSEMASEKIKLMLKIRYTLNEEQRNKLVAIVRQSKESVEAPRNMPASK